MTDKVPPCPYPEVKQENWELASRDAGLGVNHIWWKTDCPAYRNLEPNDCTCNTREIVLPYSEVCMFMGVAGKTMRARFVGENAIQLLREDGTMFSFPITLSEAGWIRQ